MADITERAVGRHLITANKNGGTDCYGSFVFGQDFEEPQKIGWQSYKDSTGAYRTRVACDIFKANNGSCIDGKSPCTIAEFIHFPGEVITVHGFRLDVDNRVVSKGNKEDELTRPEAAYFRALMRRPGDILSRDYLHVRNLFRRNDDPHTVDTEVARLNRRLRKLTEGGENWIVPVRREGWRFGPEEDELLRVGSYVLGPRTISHEEGGEPVGLSRVENAVLQSLMGAPGVVFSRESLLAGRPPARRGDVRVIDGDIRRLRKKFGRLPGLGGGTIVTISGEGYSFEPSGLQE